MGETDERFVRWLKDNMEGAGVPAEGVARLMKMSPFTLDDRMKYGGFSLLNARLAFKAFGATPEDLAGIFL